LGWVKAEPGALAFGRVRLELEADLSRQVLRVWSHGRVIRRIRVGIGRPGTTTPTGRFSITDKMLGSSLGPYYGCCLLALSGNQPHPPPGWTGGRPPGVPRHPPPPAPRLPGRPPPGDPRRRLRRGQRGLPPRLVRRPALPDARRAVGH